MGLITTCCSCLPQRYILCLNIVLGLGLCYMMRVCLSLAMSEMTFKITKNVTISEGYCPYEGNLTSAVSSKNAEFHWSAHLQHEILSSLFIGYVISHLPGGVLADYLGGKHVFGAGAVMSSIASLMAPTLARMSPYAFMLCRITQGLSQGLMFPSMSSLIAKWAPPNERATMVGICNSGIMLGLSLGNFLSGLILHYIPGWESVFYIYGFAGLVWWLLWCFLTYSSPEDHPFISEEERHMLTTQLQSKKKPKHVPFRQILTSKPYMSLVLINFGHAWALFTMVNELPMYLSNVLHFNIKTSGAVSALPYLAMWIAGIGFGILSDWITTNRLMSTTNNRKLFSFLSNLLPVPFLLGASFAGCNTVLASTFFIIMMFFKGMAYSSLRANNIDLSPNYAGVLMAIMNGLGGFAGLVTPWVVGFVITGEGSVDEWRTAFFICAVLMTALCIPYLIWGSADVQPWNSVEEKGDTEMQQSLGKSSDTSRQSSVKT